MKAKELFTKAMNFADDHQREILVGLELAGIVTTAVLSWKAGIKADKILKEQKEKMDEIPEDAADERKEITIETIKKMAPVIVPPLVTGAATVACAISGYNASTRQIAALTAAWNLSKDSLKELEDKATEMLGDKKVQQVKDEVLADKVVSNPPKGETIINTGKGNTPVYDPKSGRYFYSSPEAVKAAANRINLRIMEEYYISLNEFYDELGLPDVELGDDIGFNVDDGLIDVDHLFGVTKTDGDIPTLVLDYDVSPKFMEHRGKMFR